MGMGLVFPFMTWAAPSFTNITDQDMKDIAEGMGANFTHNSMMGASKLGDVFGFQVGLVGAQTSTKEIADIIERSGGSGVDSLYNAGVMAAVGIPFGLSFEVVSMPTYKSDDAKAASSSAAIKLNMNDMIPILPVNLALRGVSSSAEFKFTQSGATISDKTTVTGVQLLLSPMIPIVEPYVGVGSLSSKTELKTTGSSIFSGSTLLEDSKTVTGIQYLAGVEVSLLFLKFGAEYSTAFGNSRTGVKLSFGF